MVIRHNSFLCTDRVALRMDPRYNDAQMRVAQENFFGTADEQLIEAMVFDKDDDLCVVAPSCFSCVCVLCRRRRRRRRRRVAAKSLPRCDPPCHMPPTSPLRTAH
jgi:hypothetical protein